MTALANIGLVNLTAHFIPRRRYIGAGRWTWQIRREFIQVTGGGDYILSTYRQSFSDTGLREARIHTDHRMVLAVLQGEGSLRNRIYVGGRM